ncbi:MAG: TIGR03663 family protein [Anaerolineae bacterium]|nr:TIGR03663 family protein [Anaerolineae bacterium]
MSTVSLRRHTLDFWKIVYIVILVLTVVTRFYGLGTRAVSHDETTHAKFSWNIYTGRGFRHDPMMHGPLLFEASAFFYFLFGVNDFTARMYTALTGVVLVMVPLLFRKWLGRFGALVASVMILISPSISYYSRYTRHDVPLMLMSLLFLWTILKYLDEGRTRWLYGMATFFPLMYASKENAYIYTAIFIALFTLPFGWWAFASNVSICNIFHLKGHRMWERPRLVGLLGAVLVMALLFGGIFLLALRGAPSSEDAQTIEGIRDASVTGVVIPWWGRVALGSTFVLALSMVVILYYGVGETLMRQSRWFDVLMVVGTLTLPLGSALLIQFIGGVDITVFYDALMAPDFSKISVPMLLSAVVVFISVLVVSVILGLWWDRNRWPTLAFIHYAVFCVFYSTLFTWGWGIVTGMVGGLAYWMSQQSVERGGQPWYYYPLIGALYEYLPLLLSGITGVGAIAYAFKRRDRIQNPESEIQSSESETAPASFIIRFFPLFLLIWALLSWIAYVYAGEKMPWLFTHIALPHILLAAWGIGCWLEDIVNGGRLAPYEWLIPAALLLLFKAWSAFRKVWLASAQTISQVDSAIQVYGALLGLIVFGGLFFWATRKTTLGRALRLIALTLTGVLFVLTMRTMFMLNFINPEMALEYIVFAHATPDVKEVLAQIDEISWRVTGTPHDIQVAYGKDGSWPFYWYMETLYPHNYYYDTTPVQESLLACPVVIAGKKEWDAVEAILGAGYVSFGYKYLWWPIEDYKDLTWERVRNALIDPEMRKALWEIAKDRDYTRYAQLRNPQSPFTLQTWPHREEFRLYIRRDLGYDIWAYRLGENGAERMTQPALLEISDPYVLGERSLSLLTRAILPGAAPRGIAVTRDGTSLYVADTAQHYIWHITSEGEVLHLWGGYGTAPGEFNEPWGVAVDLEGFVYVADTWNHRVQKFDATGNFVATWGSLFQSPVVDIYDGQGQFYGPRGIAIGPDGSIYVTDTGNKRVQVFDTRGNLLHIIAGWSKSGGSDTDIQRLNEPVGIDVSPTGEIFIADTWNRRVQVLTLEGYDIRQWEIATWGSGHPGEKPFLTFAGDIVYVDDSARQRILAFTHEGMFLWGFSLAEVGASSESGLSFPGGMSIVGDVLYIADTYTGQVLGYQLP